MFKYNNYDSCSITLRSYKPGYRSDEDQEGKSGQQRATHRLTAGPGFLIGKKVPQKITAVFCGDTNRGEGENVR